MTAPTIFTRVTVLASLLFLWYINGVPENFISTKVKLYADDVLLYNTVHAIKMTVYLSKKTSAPFNFGLINGK